MSKLVQIQYDTNCYNSYNSQTCSNMSKLVQINDMILKHVQTCSDSILYVLLRFNMIRIVMIHMILKHV